MSNQKGRIYFFWLYDDYSMGRPYVGNAWWASGERIPFKSHAKGMVPLPERADRLLKVQIVCEKARMPDMIPVHPVKGDSWGGLVSERIINDLGDAGIELPCHECEFVDTKIIDDLAGQNIARNPEWPEAEPVSRAVTYGGMKYYYLAPPAALERHAGDPNYPNYRADHDVFTQEDRKTLYCSFKIVKLARKRKWTNTRMVMCEQDASLRTRYQGHYVPTLIPLEAKAVDWPPQCVKDMLALGYRL